MSCLPTYKGIRYKSTNDLFKSIKLSDLSDEQKIILGINKYDWSKSTTSDITTKIVSRKLFNASDKTLKKGSVVEYNDKKYLFWNKNQSGKAQLINTDGTKFSGTPNVDKLTVIGSYPTVMYNSTEYIVTDNNNVYSGATGNLVYTGADNSSKVQKQRIIDAAKEQASVTQSEPVQGESSPQYYTGNITPDENTIFVFGSNPEGRHGDGAAKVAKDKFGAEYGKGEGLQGNSYALPTKDLRIKENKGLKSISPDQIIKNIQRLYEVAKQNPDKQFKVAYRNTTESSLNGYTGLEMIDMFNKAGVIPTNVIFSKEWFDTGELQLQKQEESLGSTEIPDCVGKT